LELPIQLSLKVGETRAIRLKGRGAAGFVWRYSIDGPEDVVNISLDVVGPEPGNGGASTLPPGSSRDEQAILRAVRPGHVTIALMQGRPWEQDKPPLEEHQIKVYVTG
jgi:predicted secreted protein